MSVTGWFGCQDTTVSGESSGLNNEKMVAKYALAVPALVDTVRVYTRNGGAACAVKAVIYADNAGVPSTLVAVSGEVAIGASQALGWVTFTLPTPVALSPGTYWLGFHGDSSAASVYFEYYGESNRGYYFNADTYSNGPSDPFGAMGSAGSLRRYIVYATYILNSQAQAIGNIALTGIADLFAWAPVSPLPAAGTIQLTGSAALVWRGDQHLSAGGTLALSGSADLSMATYLAASGSLALDGEAWLTTALHGEDTMAAIGGIILHGYARLRRAGETLPATDGLGWTAPDVTPPDIRGLVVSVGGLSIRRSQITDLVIELDIEGGPLSATLSVDCALSRAPRLMQTLVVTYKGQTLFRGRLEHIASNVNSSTGYTLTYAGPLIKLRDHQAFRCVYVDSDLQNWKTDQGPRTSPDTFEVASRSSGAPV